MGLHRLLQPISWVTDGEMAEVWLSQAQESALDTFCEHGVPEAGQ